MRINHVYGHLLIISVLFWMLISCQQRTSNIKTFSRQTNSITLQKVFRTDSVITVEHAIGDNGPKLFINRLKEKQESNWIKTLRKYCIKEKIKSDGINVFYRYDKLVDGWSVTCCFMPFEHDSETGKLITRMQKGKQELFFFEENICNPHTLYMRDLGWEDGDVYEFNYITPEYNESFKKYNRICVQGCYSPFQFCDINFDSEKELLINNFCTGQGERNYCVYQICDNEIKPIDHDHWLFQNISNKTRIDNKKKEIELLMSDGVFYSLSLRFIKKERPIGCDNAPRLSGYRYITELANDYHRGKHNFELIEIHESINDTTWISIRKGNQWNSYKCPREKDDGVVGEIMTKKRLEKWNASLLYLYAIEKCDPWTGSFMRENLESLVKKNPKSGYSIMLNGIEDLRDSEKVIDAMTKALTQLPIKDCKYRSLALAIRARELSFIGDTLNALKDWGNAFNIYPSDSSRLIARAMLYCENKKYTQAIADCNVLLSKNPQDYYGCLVKGITMANINRHKEAVKYFSRIAPKSVAIGWRSLSYLSLQKYELALDDAIEGLDAGCHDVYMCEFALIEADKAVHMQTMNRILSNINTIERIIHYYSFQLYDYKRAVEVWRNWLIYELESKYKKHGQYASLSGEQAWKMYLENNYMSEMKNIVDLLFMISECYEKLGDYGLSESYFQKANNILELY